MTSDPVLKIDDAKIEQIIDNPEATAKAVKLVYVNSSDDGIERIRSGKGFIYKLKNKKLSDKKHLSLPGLPQQKVLALIVSLMERTHIRVGNYEYEKLYGSFGLTTFKDKHIEVKNTNIKFSFKGKKGIHHDIDLRSKKLSRLVQQCKDIPGKELFQYYNENGDRKPVDSGMVNDYIREISGQDFTAKDFRTWAGTLHAFLAFSEMGIEEEEGKIKKNIVNALDKVAEKLGNTRTVCKKYYVHPKLISNYENKTMQRYFDALNKVDKNDSKSGLTKVEKLVMKMLKD